MLFLNLMLNAFSSVVHLIQSNGDLGPSPAGPPAGFPPVGALAVGYPYAALPTTPAGVVAVSFPATAGLVANAAPYAQGGTAAVNVTPCLILAGAAIVNPINPVPPTLPAAPLVPANGFSNFQLLIDTLDRAMHGGHEIWYQVQIAKYLSAYAATGGGFCCSKAKVGVLEWHS